MPRSRARATLVLGLAAASALVVTLLAPAADRAPVRAADPMTADPMAGVPAGPVDTLPGGPLTEPTGRAATAGVVAPVPGGGPRLVWHGRRAQRVVALTFDDGWSAATLQRIYRILVRKHVPATFFVTGIYVQRAPALWREIAAAGYPLAAHSYRHRDTRDLTPHEVAHDFAMTQAAIEGTTGRPMLGLFRPPYGARNAAIDSMAAAAGFPVVVMWDATGGDTVRGATVRSVVRNATRGRRGSIVLLHAGPRITPRALPRIIARYRARGFTFVTVPDLLRLPAETLVAGANLPAPSPASPSRRLDRPDDPGHAADTGSAPAVALATRGTVPVEGTSDPAAARPADVPPARDAAWARSEGTPLALAGYTAASLVLLVAVAALVGRRRRPTERPTTRVGAGTPDDWTPA